jgi:dinuclear metal center YbgI/SA1388 family protein
MKARRSPLTLKGPARLVPLNKLVRFCDDLLEPESFQDWSGSVNGLQMENQGMVSRIGAAVDATESTVRLAIAARVDFLLVHHGLFWSPSHPWTGKKFQLFKLMMENNVAVYSSHLPLDAHPEFGNNIQLARALGLKKIIPFYSEKGRHLSFQGRLKIDREVLQKVLQKVLGGKVHLAPGGRKDCEHIGIMTGGAGSELRKVSAEGIDTFITGEGPHWSFGLAEELGLNVFYGGHYATETFGVKALADKLSKKFSVPWTFLDYPTGL